jgi:hypothetical protein
MKKVRSIFKFFKSNKHIQKEYYINHTHLERIYNKYLHQTAFDKILDNLVFFAIVFTLSNLIARYFFEINTTLLTYLGVISKVILLIFAADLMRHFVKAKSRRDFYAHHGLDLFLVVFLSFYFLFYTYLEMFRFTIITIIKPLVSDVKYLRVFVELFEKEEKVLRHEKYK